MDIITRFLGIHDSVSKSVEIQNRIGLIADADMATSLHTSFFVGAVAVSLPTKQSSTETDTLLNSYHWANS
jgi:hypothetical protein